MKNFTYFFFIVLTIFVFNSVLKADDPQTQIVPNAYSTTPGTAVFLGPLANAPRTYQFLIHESQLTDVINKDLISFNLRLPPSATAAWPAVDGTVYANYDIYLSQSVAPAERSLTFANNVVGPQTQVRSGSLVISRNAYPFGNSPNDWGEEIIFNSIYHYGGGHLLIEIRHTGFSGTSSTTDAIGTSVSGYGTLFSACWTSSYTGVTGSQGNFTVVKINAKTTIPVELNSFTSTVIGNNVELNWTTATETNNKGFAIERKTTDGSYQEIAFVNGFGTTTEVQNYSFVDNNLLSNTYNYRLRQIDYDGTYAYHNLSNEVFVGAPTDFSLSQNYPNPFNPSTKINYSIPSAEFVNISVYNLLGEKVAELVNEMKEAGSYEVNFTTESIGNSSQLTSGIYLYKLKAGNFIQTNKMTLLR